MFVYHRSFFERTGYRIPKNNEFCDNGFEFGSLCMDLIGVRSASQRGVFRSVGEDISLRDTEHTEAGIRNGDGNCIAALGLLPSTFQFPAHMVLVSLGMC